MDKDHLVFFSINIGTLYSAFDNVKNEMVALKVEKIDKSKRILQFEYQILKDLQGKLYYNIKDYLAFAQCMTSKRIMDPIPGTSLL